MPSIGKISFLYSLLDALIIIFHSIPYERSCAKRQYRKNYYYYYYEFKLPNYAHMNISLSSLFVRSTQTNAWAWFVFTYFNSLFVRLAFFFLFFFTLDTRIIHFHMQTTWQKRIQFLHKSHDDHDDGGDEEVDVKINYNIAKVLLMGKYFGGVMAYTYNNRTW